MTITIPYRDRDVHWTPMVAPDLAQGGARSEQHIVAHAAAPGAWTSDGRPQSATANEPAEAGGSPAMTNVWSSSAKATLGQRRVAAFAAIDWDYASLSVTISIAATVSAAALALLGWGLVAVLIGADHVLPPSVLFSLQQLVQSVAVPGRFG